MLPVSVDEEDSVTPPTSKSVDLLEERVDALIGELEKTRKERKDLARNVEKLEEKTAEQAGLVDRLKKQVSATSGDLDKSYRKKRDDIRARLAHLMARLEAL
jgi:uncharacterized coiled-coil protein SlyX